MEGARRLVKGLRLDFLSTHSLGEEVRHGDPGGGRAHGTDRPGLENVGELADLTRPLAPHEGKERAGSEGERAPPVATRDPGEDLRGDRLDVLGARREGREIDRDHREPVVEVLAEALVGDGGREIDVRGRDHAHVGLLLCRAPEPIEGLRLQEGQELRLRRERELSDLVEEDGPARRGDDLAVDAPIRGGVRSPLRPEELALDERLRQRSAVDLDEGLERAWPVQVDRSRERGLPRTGGPAQEDRHVERSDESDMAEDVRERGRRARDGVDAVELRAERGGRIVERATDEEARCEGLDLARESLDEAPVGLLEGPRRVAPLQVENPDSRVRNRRAEDGADPAQGDRLELSEARILDRRRRADRLALLEGVADDPAAEAAPKLRHVIGRAVVGERERRLRIEVRATVEGDVPLGRARDLDDPAEGVLEEWPRIIRGAQGEKIAVEIALGAQAFALGHRSCFQGGHVSVNMHRVPTQMDLRIDDARVVTCTGNGDTPTEQLGVLERGTVAVRDGRIAWVGSTADAPDAARVVDAGGRVLMPGLVDPHTHLIFAGSRVDEFARRMAGEDYRKLAAEGGGIKATVRWSREASDDELFGSAAARARAMRRHGVTSAEVKSGYGLSTEHELRHLEVARRLGAEALLNVTTSLLGAHAIPPEYAADRTAYVEEIATEMIPRAAARKLADACDVYLDDGAFTRAEAERILRAARAEGLAVRAHVGQFADLGGAELAAELGALSADHLEQVSDAGLRAMAEAGVTAVLLPGAWRTLRQTPPDAARMRAFGVRIAVGTDCNPGTSPCVDLPLMASLAVRDAGLTVEEALLAITVEAARAAGLDGAGQIAPGRRADLALYDEEDPRALAYAIGGARARMVVFGGEVVEEHPSSAALW